MRDRDFVKPLESNLCGSRSFSVDKSGRQGDISLDICSSRREDRYFFSIVLFN